MLVVVLEIVGVIMASKPVHAHASRVFDIAGFSEIGESFFTWFVVTEDIVTNKQLRYIFV